MTIRFSSFLIVAIPCLIGCDDMLGSLLQTRQVNSVIVIARASRSHVIRESRQVILICQPLIQSYAAS
jgi:hypothetical protein